MMTDRQLGCRERPTGTTEYLLSYGQPRVSPDVGVVMYEARRLRAERDDGDGAAVEWARDVVPYEFGLTYAGRQYLAAPMVDARQSGCEGSVNLDEKVSPDA